MFYTFYVLEGDDVLVSPRPAPCLLPDLPACSEEWGVAGGGGPLAPVPQPAVCVAHQAAHQPALARQAVVDVVLPSVLLVHGPAHRQRSSYRHM